jgi:formylglycine-generating enzyme required for sulfatase activity
MYRPLSILLACLFVTFFFTQAIAEEYIDPTTGMTLIFIKGGTFTMGDDSREDLSATPAHQVTLNDFYMGKHEVTFAQYDLFCKETGKEKPADKGWGRGNRPVINISWQDANNFAAWLSDKTGKSFRLPSESEWEYAARGGTTTFYWWGDKMIENIANYRKAGTEWEGQTAPVGSFAASPYGLHDTTGNVNEWVLDNYNETYEKTPTDGSPNLSGDASTKMERGGGWTFMPDDISPIARCWSIANRGYDEVGFRLLMEP